MQKLFRSDSGRGSGPGGTRLARLGRTLLVVAILWTGVALGGCARPTPGGSGSAGGTTAEAGTPASGWQPGGGLVSAEAVIVPCREALLNFLVTGRVAEVLVAEGQTVAAGQELIRLDTSDLDQAVAQAEAGLKSAQAQAALVQAGARSQEVAAVEAGVSMAAAEAHAAAGAVKEAEANLASAEADVAAAQAAVKVAEGRLAGAQAALRGAQASARKLKAGPTAEELQIAAEQIEVEKGELYYLQKRRDLAGDVYEGELQGHELLVKLAELQLERLKAGAGKEELASADAQVAQAQANVEIRGQEIEYARAQVLQAQAAVQTLEAQVAQAQAQLDGAAANQAQAAAQLDLVKAGSQAEDVAAADAGVAQAEAALAQARAARDDATLRAPFAGTVGAVLVEAGEIVLPQSVAVRLGDLTRLRVETEDLSEVDVGQIQAGQVAWVTVDALGGQTFQATVARVSPLSSERRGDTVYAVTADLDRGTEAGLRWGMSAFVEIAVEPGASSSPGSSAQGDQETAPSVVSAEGRLEPVRQADLSFKTGGRIQAIRVSEGDAVAAGQELARLETGSLEQGVAQAKARLAAAEAQLAKAQAGSRPEQVTVASATLAAAQSAEKAAAGAESVAESNVAAAQAGKDAAEKQVDVARGGLAAAQAALAGAQADLDRLQAGPSALEVQLAELNVRLAEVELQTLQSINPATRNVLGGKVGAAQAKLAVAHLQLALLQAGAGAEDLAMAQSQVDQAKADLQTAEAQVAQTETQVGKAVAGVDRAQAQLEQAQANHERATAQTGQAQAQLDLVQAGSRPEEIAAAEAGVAQARAAVTAAENALADAVLQAPFDGIVGSILAEEGELVGPQRALFRLGDLSRLRVETQDLSEVDIDLAQVGQQATVTVDALGGERFQATVAEIATVALERLGDRVFTVTLDLDAGPAEGLRWGMTAFVEIEIP